LSKEKLKPLSIFLREKRRLAGLSQSAVAKKLGYTTPQFVSNWERGLAAPPISALRKISTLYKVPLEEMHRRTLEAMIEQVTEEVRTKFYGSVK
jgi:transcriptional regulator with XRE-family HTH domain